MTTKTTLKNNQLCVYEKVTILPGFFGREKSSLLKSKVLMNEQCWGLPNIKEFSSSSFQQKTQIEEKNFLTRIMLAGTRLRSTGLEGIDMNIWSSFLI